MTSVSAETWWSVGFPRAVTYDPAGNPLRIEDGESRQFELQYDELGRRIQARGPIGFPTEETTTALRYDQVGRLLEKTEALGEAEERSTQLRYDVLGRLVETTDALGRKAFFGYDALGNLAESVNAAGERIRYRHDQRGLLLERTGPGIPDSYAYDGFGRQVLSENGEVTRRFEYDALDRAIAVWDSHFGTARRVYDADGRITQAVYPDAATYGFPEGVGVTYLHDARNQVVSVVDPVAGAWQLDYDALGRLVRRTDPGGFERFITHTPEGFVDRVTLEGPSGVIDEFVYADYDTLGNPHTITSGEGTTTIAYDARSHVTSVDYPGPESESFGYDRLGNRTSHTDRSGASFTYEHDAADQLLAILDAAQQPTASFTYDGAGRRATRTAGGETTSYGYDAAGRLTDVNRPGYSMALAYDPEGSRYSRSETGELDALFFGEWVERRGGETLRLTHGPGIDNVIAEVTAGSAVRTLMRNGTANVSHVTVDGTLEAAPRRYEAFGAVRTGSSVVERGFAGRPPEGASGLINMRARHYDPATGSFLQTDPLGIGAAQLYAYAASNPYVFGDTTGLDPTYLQVGMSSLNAEIAPIIGNYLWNGPLPESSSQSIGSALWSGAKSLGLIGAGFIPYVGDGLDIYDVARPGASAFDRSVGGASLAINAWTAGLAPNAGPIIRGLRGVGDAVDAVLGGRYGAVRAANIGGEVHHMPANSVSGLSRNQGPAILMDPADHALTASHGRQGRAGALHRAQQEALIRQGRFDDAIQMDIDNIQSLFPDGRYDEAILQMIDSLD